MMHGGVIVSQSITALETEKRPGNEEVLQIHIQLVKKFENVHRAMMGYFADSICVFRTRYSLISICL